MTNYPDSMMTFLQSKNHLCIDGVGLYHIQGSKCMFTLEGGYAPLLEHGGEGRPPTDVLTVPCSVCLSSYWNKWLYFCVSKVELKK